VKRVPCVVLEQGLCIIASWFFRGTRALAVC
jgi:hypothetical protein